MWSQWLDLLVCISQYMIVQFLVENIYMNYGLAVHAEHTTDLYTKNVCSFFSEEYQQKYT